MADMLFTERSLWTMAHGMVFGGGGLLGLGALLFALAAMARDAPADALRREARHLGRLSVLVAVLLWGAVVVGTYVSFPPYRANPPAGTTDLRAYPKARILADPGSAWLHTNAMEAKEHMPWIAAMLATAVAFVSARHGSAMLADPRLRGATTAMVAICFAIVAFVSVLGVFVNKVAPLE